MTLVKKTFLLFLIAFIFQISVVALVVGFGLDRSETQWQRVRAHQAYDTAQALLLGDEIEGGYAGQLAVFSPDGQLLQSSRGMGMHGNMGRTMMAQMQPIYRNDQLIGYYATGDISFASDSANQTVMSTMLIALVISLVLSLGIALAAALYFSRKVSRPADYLALQLETMTRGDLSQPVSAAGSHELVRIAESVEQLRNKLLHEQTIRAQWSQDIAHDLRTPVASVKAQLEGMRDGILPPDTPRFERTLHELERMEQLIRDLETLIRLEDPGSQAAYERIDVQTFLQELSEQFDAQLVQQQTSLVTHSTVDYLFADEQLLSRAVSNLMSNALRYGSTGTPVTITVSSQQVAVHNQGNPIPASEIPKLTQRLYRGEYARSTFGSGLGLTIVERIARLHNGSVSITSDVQSGTVVTIHLARQESEIGNT